MMCLHSPTKKMRFKEARKLARRQELATGTSVGDKEENIIHTPMFLSVQKDNVDYIFYLDELKEVHRPNCGREDETYMLLDIKTILLYSIRFSTGKEMKLGSSALFEYRSSQQFRFTSLLNAYECVVGGKCSEHDLKNVFHILLQNEERVPFSAIHECFNHEKVRPNYMEMNLLIDRHEHLVKQMKKGSKKRSQTEALPTVEEPTIKRRKRGDDGSVLDPVPVECKIDTALLSSSSKDTVNSNISVFVAEEEEEIDLNLSDDE